MSKNKLYKSLIRANVEEILNRIRDEQEQIKNKEVIDNITTLVKQSRKHPTLTEAKIYLEILEQEYPLVMSMTDYDIIRMAEQLLGVNITWKHLYMLQQTARPNPYYEIIYLY